ncbi:Sjogren's syndrome/scleroderma autoantigen 1 family protein [Methanosalsum natronophilum]|uniref:Sjogren's syndrome/scleroderma autoantigen 1 family protein n=1 Tax=Methanosalsum natronophilum TaxID=768733 RepID=UPI00216781D3|nr:Sjogren's syndrome/scleroderma autoantigen 1 family protein [Methanosalsum natronophilum]MCS3923801.1 UPF0148 protein [Methanosalsum natronophilum]
MSINNEDEKVKKISRLLELGATMLAQHCEDCGAPHFRYSGQIICPVCDVEMKQDTSTPEQPAPSQSLSSAQSGFNESEQDIESIPPKNHSPDSSAYEHVTRTQVELTEEMEQSMNLIIAKILDLSHSIQKENDIRRIRETFEVINEGIDLVERIKKQV